MLYEGSTDRALGAHVAAVLDAAYWRIGQALSIYPSETLNVILYTNRQFRDITRAGLGGRRLRRPHPASCGRRAALSEVARARRHA